MMIFLYTWHVEVFCMLVTWYWLFCQAIPSSGTDNYNLVDALESRILPFWYIWSMTNILTLILWMFYWPHNIDISEVDKNQLVLYAQMANLVQLILPSFELDLKEITHTFSKVMLLKVIRLLVYATFIA